MHPAPLRWHRADVRYVRFLNPGFATSILSNRQCLQNRIHQFLRQSWNRRRQPSLLRRVLGLLVRSLRSQSRSPTTFQWLFIGMSIPLSLLILLNLVRSPRLFRLLSLHVYLHRSLIPHLPAPLLVFFLRPRLLPLAPLCPTESFLLHPCALHLTRISLLSLPSARALFIPAILVLFPRLQCTLLPRLILSILRSFLYLTLLRFSLPAFLLLPLRVPLILPRRMHFILLPRLRSRF